MRKTLMGLIFFVISKTIFSQLCPGGGVSFSSAVVFDQSWISGCITGTSCNGGVEFDNRAACEPTTAMDGCAPGPTCTTNSQDGSDIWFSFFATAATASINVIQNVSFVACIQAFSGGPACALTEIGCAKASGPSSGVTLNLSGLTVNQQYYFRVFGSASAASQRTGTFCFCGSTGLGSTVLPVSLSHFSATAIERDAEIKWSTLSENGNSHFEIEKSIDGISFSKLAIVRGSGNSASLKNYSYSDKALAAGIFFYRLKQVDLDGRFTYSSIVSVKIRLREFLSVFPVPATDQLIIESVGTMELFLYNSTGQYVKNLWVKEGKNLLPVSGLRPGVYWLKTADERASQKFVISR